MHNQSINHKEFLQVVPNNLTTKANFFWETMYLGNHFVFVGVLLFLKYYTVSQAG